MSYGCMGGDGQPQTQAQIFTRYRFGMDPAAAVDAPRWLLGRTWGQDSTTLKLENRFDPDIVSGLAARGQVVEEIGMPYADLARSWGHAGAPLPGRAYRGHHTIRAQAGCGTRDGGRMNQARPDPRARYAIYFAPHPKTPLWRFGFARPRLRFRRVAKTCPDPDLGAITPERLAELTQRPRIYGFHATIKPPIRLAEGCDEPGLIAALDCLLRRLRAGHAGPARHRGARGRW